MTTERFFPQPSNLPPQTPHFCFSSPPPLSLIFHLDANFSDFRTPRSLPLPLAARFPPLPVLGLSNRPLTAYQSTIPAIDAGLVASENLPPRPGPKALRPLFGRCSRPIQSKSSSCVPSDHTSTPRALFARLPTQSAPPSGCGRSPQGHDRHGACQAISLWRACHPSSGGLREPRSAGARGVARGRTRMLSKRDLQRANRRAS
jgi:hypothetical protein